MKIYIGRIPGELRDEDVRSFFETFGEIADFNFKGAYAFVEYRDEGVAHRVLENRDYQIGDHSVFVEESIGRKRQRSDGNGEDFGRRPPAGGFDDYPRGRPYHEPVPPYEDHYDPYRRRDPYAERIPPPPAPYYNDRRAPDYYRGGYPEEPLPRGGDPRDDCPHCSRCEVHGIPPRRGGDFDRPKRPKRDHPNDVNKIVIECLPRDVTINDVEDLVRREGYEVVFSRLTVRGDSAIVELRDIESKEDAMVKLQGKEINGTQISVRNFKTNVTPSYNQNDNYNSERREDSQGVDIYSGIDSVNVD